MDATITCGCVSSSKLVCVKNMKEWRDEKFYREIRA
jgi:hypothetical protein